MLEVRSHPPLGRWGVLGLTVLGVSGPVSATEHPTPWSGESPCSLADLQLEHDAFRRVTADGLTLTDEALTVHLDAGAVVPMVCGGTGSLHERIVGLAWSGEGRALLRLDDRADAMHLANRLVRDLGQDPEEVQPFAKGRSPLSLRVDGGIFVVPRSVLLEVFPPSSDDASSDPLELFVYGDKGVSADAARAGRLFTQRLALYRDLPRHASWERDPAHMVAVGRASGVGSDVAGGWIDLRTDLRLGRLVGSGMVDSQDRWMTWARDERHPVRADPYRVAVAALWRNDGGEARSGLLSGYPFPLVDEGDPMGARAPRVRFEPGAAQTSARVETVGLALDVQLDSRLSLRAVGGAQSRLVLDFHVHQAARPWRLLDLSLADGTPLHTVQRPPIRLGDKRTGMTSVRLEVQLPMTVQEGAEISVDARTGDSWHFVRQSLCTTTGDSGPRIVPTSDIVAYLPEVPGSLGTWAATADARLGKRMRLIAARGPAPDASPEPVRRGARAANGIAVGTWPAHHEEPGALDFPAFSVSLARDRDREVGLIPAEVRRVMSYLSGWLPPVGLEEVQVVELPQRCMKAVPRILLPGEPDARPAPRGCGASARLPPEGFIPYRRLGILTKRGSQNTQEILMKVLDAVPHHGHMRLAHDVAHQQWGHLGIPQDTRDLWIAESFAEGFACMYVSRTSLLSQPNPAFSHR